MKKRWLCLSLAAALTLSAALLGACAPGDDPGDGPGEEPGNEPELSAYVMPTWNGRDNSDTPDETVSVHDPSIFLDPVSGTYYAFGTHYAVASTTDFINWKQEVSDNDFASLYGSETAIGYSAWPKALQDTLTLVKPNSNSTTTWAPDVNYYDGTYYMYYSLTRGFGERISAIGRVESDNVLGPYSNNRIIVESVTQSGPNCIDPELFYDVESVKQSGPNCIDPELFYDKDGKLWMVYGSSFGGLYIKELYNEGENWGLPKEEGFGKRLWSGSNNQEGPFIFYNEDTDYYYMMVSYGSLMTTYNMRVARSENPDGPYVDITGADMATVTGDSGGNKIAGNYIMGEAFDGAGYAAIGHNSVIEADGKYFVIAHARRQSGLGNDVTEGHNLYAFQLYFNEDGWPVMNPNRYAGEALGTGMTVQKLAGEYDVVQHSTGTVQNFVQSVAYNFNADGTITDGDGAAAGSWSLTENWYVTVTLGEVTYKGVATPSYTMYVRSYDDDYATYSRFSLTAVSDTGRSLWAVGTFAAT